MNRLDRWVTFIAKWTALAGGFVLVLLTISTVLSISGRAMLTMASLHDAVGWQTIFYPVLKSVGGFFTGFGVGPIPGDYELVEAGTAFAVFSFLPWCQLNRGHATVELLTGAFPPLMNRIIDVVADSLMLAIALLLAWRHWLGTVDKYNYGEITFILQFPLWWGYAASMLGAVVFILVAAYCLLRSLTGMQVRTAGAHH